MLIEYSTSQFSEESKEGGGAEIHPPRSLRYRKKRGPQRVKCSILMILQESFDHAL